MPLNSRARWDGYGDVSTAGDRDVIRHLRLADDAVLDEEGGIRYVDLRQEELLKGVRQRMSELTRKTLATKRP